MAATPRTVKILGIDFFQGTAAQAVHSMRDGGLLVVPAAPALKDLGTNQGYREALLGADVTITDSAFMVLIWNRLAGTRLSRLSGLEYLRELLTRADVRAPGGTLWIMPGQASAERNLGWLREQGIEVPDTHSYLAPMYGKTIDDAPLLEQLDRLRPAHIIVAVGGGTQERLGLYIKQKLAYRPAIHCIGAAIGFLSGDQVHIPVWADKAYLGWLFRVVSQPKVYGKRYWEARKLWALMRRYRDQLPVDVDSAKGAG